MAAISIKDMCISYNKGKSFVLDHLNLEIKDGEFCVFLGPSGCGKSTAMYSIAGLLEPYQSPELSSTPSTYIDPTGTLTQFEGRCEGHINFAPTRSDAFGYDPVFIPEGLDVTMAEIPVEVKNGLSHRGKAMDQLVCHLKQNLAR